MKKIIYLLMIIGFLHVFSSCQDGPEPEAEMYVVTFEANGGIDITSQNVLDGGLVTEPDNVFYEGYSLIGWYADSGLTDLWNFETDTVSSNMTLYASWFDLFADKFSVDDETNGYFVWNNDTADDYDVGYDIQVDSDGNVFVVGYSINGVDPTTEEDLAIWKLTRAGVLDNNFGTGGIVFRDGGHASTPKDLAYGMAMVSDGSIYVAGESYLGLTNSCIWKQTENGSDDNNFDGDGRLVTTVGDAGASNAWAKDIAAGKDGSLYATGYYKNTSGDDSGRDDAFLIKYSSSGALDTSGFGTDGYVKQNVSGSGVTSSYDGAHAVYPTADAIYVTGYTRDDGSSNTDMILWKYELDGTLDSSFGTGGYVVNHPAGDESSHGNALAVDDGGNIYVVGVLNNGTNDDMAFWKYNSSGNPVSSFGTGGLVISHGAAEGDGDDAGNDIVIDSSGGIYICGGSENDRDPVSLDMVLWKYDQSGNPDNTFHVDGVMNHNGAASTGGEKNDLGLALALDPADNIYVAGYSVNTSDDMDMVVWKYNWSGGYFGN